ncbi:MAG: TerB family tellurite resistance protein [Alphaproteobacteria bacterium]|nr:TerB family tellurite resistance protein [Alphaproteobacteria bacterium]
MLKKLKQLIEGEPSDDDAGPEDTHLAAAVLMVEAAALDGEFDDDERERIIHILERHFELSAEDADELVEMAVEEQHHAGHLHRFTQRIKDAYSEEERTHLIELLWEVVYADGELHDYEANLLRRVAGLIYVTDRDRGDARKRALKRLGLEDI